MWCEWFERELGYFPGTETEVDKRLEPVEPGAVPGVFDECLEVDWDLLAFRGKYKSWVCSWSRRRYRRWRGTRTALMRRRRIPCWTDACTTASLTSWRLAWQSTICYCRNRNCWNSRPGAKSSFRSRSTLSRSRKSRSIGAGQGYQSNT